VAQAVLDFFEAPKNQQLLADLREAGLTFSEDRPAKVAPRETPLKGKTFVLTGTLAGLTRDEAGALVEQSGG
jgi:DNA ligase (NAD+)